MPLAIFLISFVLLSGLFGFLKALKAAGTRAERSLMMRFGIFLVGIAVFSLLLLVRLPFQFVLLAMPPLFFVVVMSNKVFERARARVRRDSTPDFERMKRVN